VVGWIDFGITRSQETNEPRHHLGQHHDFSHESSRLDKAGSVVTLSLIPNSHVSYQHASGIRVKDQTHSVHLNGGRCSTVRTAALPVRKHVPSHPSAGKTGHTVASAVAAARHGHGPSCTGEEAQASRRVVFTDDYDIGEVDVAVRSTTCDVQQCRTARLPVCPTSWWGMSIRVDKTVRRPASLVVPPR